MAGGLGLRRIGKLPQVGSLARTRPAGGGVPLGPYVYDFVADTGPSGTSTAGLGGSTPRRTASGLTVQTISGLQHLDSGLIPANVGSWTATGGSLVTGQTDADGFTSAVKLVEDTSNGYHYISPGTLTNNNSVVTAGSKEWTLDFKPAGRSYFGVYLSFSNGGTANFNVGLTGSGMIGAFTAPVTAARIVPIAGGFYRLTMTATVPSGGAASANFSLATSMTTNSYTGDGVSGIIIRGGTVGEDIVSVPVPADSTGAATITFDDNSTQTVAKLEPGTWWKLEGLARTLIKSISLARGAASLNYGPIALGFGTEFPQSQVPGGYQTASAGQMYQNDFKVWIGGAGGDFFRVLLSGVNQGLDREYDTTTTQPIEMDFSDPATGKVVRVTFAGNRFGSIPAGAVEYLSDPIYPHAFGLTSAGWRNRRLDGRLARVSTSAMDLSITRGTTVYTSMPTDQSVTGSSYSSVGLSSGTSMLGLPGASTFAQMLIPTALVGRSATPVPAVFGNGDSIFRGQADAYDPTTNGGWFFRGLYNYNGSGGIMPATRFAKDAASPVSAITGADSVVGSAKKFALTKYFTHFVSNHAHNGTGAGAGTAAYLLSINKQAWALAKNTTGSKIKRVEHVLALPETQGSSNFTSDAGQTFNTGYQFLLDWNALLLTTVGTQNLDAVIDLNTGYVMSSTKANVFSSVGGAFTPEGTHLTALGSASAAIPWKARAASYTLPAP